MRVLVYSTRRYDRDFLDAANHKRHELNFTSAVLDERTAVLARGSPAISCFVQDNLGAEVLRKLHAEGVRLVTLRATGFNNVDLPVAGELGMTVMRVKTYSPYSVAEFAAGMILTLNRNIHRAYHRIKDGNFLLEGLLGFDLKERTVGVVGTGRIGAVFTRIMHGFGCYLLGYDIIKNPDCVEMGMLYVPLEDLLSRSDIVSLHIPLSPATHHMINERTLRMMKEGSMLINTSRGALVDTQALIPHLKDCRLCAVGLDVYEEESHLYYRDLSDEIISDDTITRLLAFPNVLITGHQGFFTREAMTTIAETTILNISDFESGRINENLLRPEQVLAGA